MIGWIASLQFSKRARHAFLQVSKGKAFLRDIVVLLYKWNAGVRISQERLKVTEKLVPVNFLYSGQYNKAITLCFIQNHEIRAQEKLRAKSCQHKWQNHSGFSSFCFSRAYGQLHQWTQGSLRLAHFFQSALFISKQEAAWAADVKREIGDRSSGDPFPVKKIETRQTRTMLVVNVFNLSDK